MSQSNIANQANLLEGLCDAPLHFNEANLTCI